MAGEVAAQVAIVGTDAGVGPIPRGDDTFLQREGRVGDDLGRIRSKADAKPGAFRTSALGAIEREVAGRETGCTVAGLRIFGFGRERQIRLPGGLGEVSRGEGDYQASLAQAEGQFHGVSKTGAAGLLDLESIDDQFEILRFRGRGEVDPFPLAAGTKEAFLFQADGVGRGEGGQEDGKSTGLFAQETIDNLGGRSGEERPAGLGVVRGTVGCKENAEVVVNFRGSGEGGTAGAAGVALFHGQSGRKPLDGIHGRGGKAFQMQAGVDGQAFEVPALAFRVDRVEGQRGFAGAGGAGQDDETVFRDVEIESG